MLGRLWMLTPMLAGATIALLAWGVSERPDASVAGQPCGTLVASAEAGVMTDAAPDACVFAVAAVEAPCDDAKLVHVSMTNDSTEPADVTLEWPGDFVALTLEAAVAVWDTTVWVLDEAFGFAQRHVALLWI